MGETPSRQSIGRITAHGNFICQFGRRYSSKGLHDIQCNECAYHAQHGVE